jgi:uncharacterized protein YkwD
MRQVWRLAICFIVGWFLVGAIASVVPQTLESEPTTAPVVQLLNLTKRSSHGSPPLKLAEPLNRAAQLHAEDLATHNFFSHTGSDGSSVGSRVTRENYRTVGENIYRGTRSAPEQGIAGWMRSPGHRRNLLSPRFTEVGFGIAQGGSDIFYVQVLARPF